MKKGLALLLIAAALLLSGCSTLLEPKQTLQQRLDELTVELRKPVYERQIQTSTGEIAASSEALTENTGAYGD